MNTTNYFVKFNADGKIKKVLLAGVHIKTDEQRQHFVNEGYTPIDVETYNVMLGNRDMGDNGTGYVWDDKTGKPVSAPPAPPVETTEVPTANVPETELAVMEGMVDMQSRIAALEAELAKLKGGK